MVVRLLFWLWIEKSLLLSELLAYVVLCRVSLTWVV